jgi:hypothetical protein
MSKFKIEKSSVSRIVNDEPRFIGVVLELRRSRDEWDADDRISIEVALPHNVDRPLEQIMLDAQKAAAAALRAAASELD